MAAALFLGGLQHHVQTGLELMKTQTNKEYTQSARTGTLTPLHASVD